MENKEQFISVGITSECSDGKHVYFGDCDNRNIDVAYVVWRLQRKGLSEILVISTTNGYNFVAFDKMELNEIKEINDSISVMDKIFNKANYDRGYYTLRLGKEKQVYAMYKDINTLFPKDNSKSNAHRIFFENIFGKNIPKDASYDNKTYFQLVFYEDTKKKAIANNELVKPEFDYMDRRIRGAKL